MMRTHESRAALCWRAAMAFARMGDNRRSWELFTMINPVIHARTSEEAAFYKVEPYVVAADVYAASLHAGCGGWTWYTGSAAWMYRLIMELLLGLRLEVDKLHFMPCLPADWVGFKMHYRYRETVYHIEVLQTPAGIGEMCVSMDNNEQPEKPFLLLTTMRNTGLRSEYRFQVDRLKVITSEQFYLAFSLIFLAVLSYMTVMLNVTDAADGFPPIPHPLFQFNPHNQSLALLFCAGFLWHVRCFSIH